MLATVAGLRTDALLAQGASAPDALTDGFAWLFLGAAALCLIGAGVTAAVRKR